MTLKQWLDSYDMGANPLSAERIRALTEAHAADHQQKAEAAFNAAFLKLQGQLPVIDEKGTIQYRDGRQGTYALNEDIQDAILPILQQHGFTLHFESVGKTLVNGILTHKRGHQRRSQFESDVDLTGGKTIAQARGSILSYAHRYTTIDLLNLVTRGLDNDGASAGFKFAFDPSLLPTPEAKATFKRLIEASLDDELDECWKGLDTGERASVGFEGLQYVKQLAGYVR